MTTRQASKGDGRSQKLATSRGRLETSIERAIGYVRVSRVSGRAGESFISPEVQSSTIELKAKSAGLELVETVTDLDQSGGKYDRPGFQRALEAVERGEADVIVVARLTRFARSVLDTHRALERLEAAGGRLIAADVDVDVSTPTGRLMRNMLASLAEFELELVSEQWAVAKEKAVERGVKIASTAPFGYRFDSEHRLKVESAEAAIVRELFELRATGASWGKMLELFEQRTGRSSSRQTMAGLARNRAYLGHVHYGSDRDRELLNEDAHEAIIELELFEEVQRVNSERAGERRERVGHAGAPTSLLGGIARCASCGRGLVRTTSGGGKTRRGGYKCPNDARKCKARAYIGQAELDLFVETSLLEWAGEAADEVVEIELGAELESAGDRIVAEHRLAEAESSLAHYVSDVAAELADHPAAYAAGLKARRELVDRRRQELEAFGAASELEVVRTTLRAAWPTLELAERRDLLKSVLAAVVVRRTPRRGAPASERAELVFKDVDVSTEVGPTVGEPSADDASELG